MKARIIASAIAAATTAGVAAIADKLTGRDPARRAQCCEACTQLTYPAEQPHRCRAGSSDGPLTAPGALAAAIETERQARASQVLDR